MNVTDGYVRGIRAATGAALPPAAAERAQALLAAVREAAGAPANDTPAFDAVAEVARRAYAAGVPGPAAFCAAALAGTTEAPDVRAFAVGVEAQLRLAGALDPSGGWDVWCATGAVGAAVAAATAAGADDAVLRHAIGAAAAQTTGCGATGDLVLGAVCAGLAAANGWLAFRLATDGFTAPLQPLDAERGYLRLLGGSPSDALTDAWGTRWQLAELAA